ncbi:MAG TPA: ABC transporter ATP-binding protein [Nitrososphaerales archaeon]|nr:ABC transporter ATP-binding protein [Nitrososphaerales archaeon]
MNSEGNPLAIQMIDVKKSYRTFGPGWAILVGDSSTMNFVNFFRMITGRAVKRAMALDGVSFDVKPGEVFGLLGPNGAGKTTIIKILSTLVLPDSGKVLVDNINVVKRPRATVRHVQTVLSESTGFDRRLTGRNSLEFFADLYGIPKKISRPRIDELLAFTGMSEWADVMFQRYSTGMMRRLLVCRALLSNASVLLFDEPTSALDPISAADFRKLIRHQLADKEGKTILLATHNLMEAEQICDRIALLRKGKIIAIGTPEEIKKTVSNKVSLSIFVTNLLPETEKAVTDSLLEVRGVQSVEVQENAIDGGRTRLNIEGEKDINYNQVFEKLSNMRVEVLSIESSQPTLEEAFLKLNLEATS